MRGFVTKGTATAIFKRRHGSVIDSIFSGDPSK